ncbi:hypothetical protein EXE30_10820 [Acinetobacter halotolerans]|uniref:Uncharacterized protein n=1 Tax=Acinetobacter halotolerans TaxID=1752076 RepID=A0A4Q6X8C2_9GAMM|nr:hypothetical protein [Acinetobacter halotolerans]RZF51695.1 hypothetical protein EXE30_10820 [Acinetobacter halotolerans]
MDWTPMEEVEILDTINASYSRMTLEQRRLWEVIKLYPQKWSQEPYGDIGNGFWVVAIIGNTVIWFNDIEDGFNRSSFFEFGKINEYYCNQDDLEWHIQNVLNQIRDGYDAAGYCSGAKSFIK